MKVFCLLLFAFFMVTCGLCQEPAHITSDAMRIDVVDGLISVEDAGCSEDLLMGMFSEESQDVIEEPLSPVSLGIMVTPQFDYKESKYWGRYTALRTAGWVTFGAGMGFFIGGYAMILGAWATDCDAADGLGVAGSCMLFSAPVLVLTSIPLLACAYYNRSKAKKMFLNAEASILPSGGASPYKTSTPALTLSLTF